MIRSRTTPPPIAVINPSTSAPNRSTRAARTATSAPPIPNAKVPSRSNATSSEGACMRAIFAQHGREVTNAVLKTILRGHFDTPATRGSRRTIHPRHQRKSHSDVYLWTGWDTAPDRWMMWIVLPTGHRGDAAVAAQPRPERHDQGADRFRPQVVQPHQIRTGSVTPGCALGTVLNRSGGARKGRVRTTRPRGQYRSPRIEAPPKRRPRQAPDDHSLRERNLREPAPAHSARVPNASVRPNWNQDQNNTGIAITAALSGIFQQSAFRGIADPATGECSAPTAARTVQFRTS